MCGIFAYSGSDDAGKVIKNGLERLEYRGYDSWGVCVIGNKSLETFKTIGKISERGEIKFPKSTIGIGHTRWATTGGVTNGNAHPHLSSDKSFSLAQNGIVENFKQLKNDLLKRGFLFISETDTEVIVRAIEDEIDNGSDLIDSIKIVFRKLKGRNTFVILDKKGKRIIACKNGSPLVVGMNSINGDICISSDALSFSNLVDRMMVLENEEMVVIEDNKVTVTIIGKDGNVPLRMADIGLLSNKIDKSGFEDFTIKEIFDTPEAINNLVIQEPEELLKLVEVIKESKTIYCIGSGTAGIAAAQIAYYLREIGGVEVTSLIGAEAKDYYQFFDKDDLIIAPSQSGETADVLEVLEYAKKKGTKIASLVNMPGSMMTRLSDFKFMVSAGPEISVLSTKVFTAQIAWGYLLSKTVRGQSNEAVSDLKRLSSKMDEYLRSSVRTSELSRTVSLLKNVDDIFLIGKGQNKNIAMEGMVKLIEGTYKHAHAIPAGDLKHYAITLMQKGVIVIAVTNKDGSQDEIENAINQIKARGARVVEIGKDIKVPDCGDIQAAMNVIPLQLMAYHLAKELKLDIDKPRNIAKSVTVK